MPRGRRLGRTRKLEPTPGPKYMLQASYAAEGVKGLIKDTASGCRVAVKAGVNEALVAQHLSPRSRLKRLWSVRPFAIKEMR
jgi:hypothetical protein